MKWNHVLSFWFGEKLDDPAEVEEQHKRWFIASTDLDRELRDRFTGLLEQADLDEFDGWRQEPKPTLALILLFDQFPRNIFRGSARAFSYDEKARALTNACLENGWDRQLHPLEATFVYLPLEHSEDITDQNRCVELYSSLQLRAPAGMEKMFAGFLEYGILHRDIIVRFGRFPHRNDVLGRKSTDEEKAYLASEGHGFGQTTACPRPTRTG